MVLDGLSVLLSPFTSATSWSHRPKEREHVTCATPFQKVAASLVWTSISLLLSRRIEQ